MQRGPQSRTVSYIGLFAGALCLSLAACGETESESSLASQTDKVEYRYSDGQETVSVVPFGEFRLKPISESGDEGYRVSLTYKGKNLNTADDVYRNITAYPPLADVPVKGCSTRQIEMFTGGANCCFGYYLLTSCDNADYALVSPPDTQRGIGDVVTLDGDTGMKGITVGDNAFMYYEKEGPSGQGGISLSGAESPRPTRFIVFDNGLWRLDKPGEFPTAYQTLYQDTEASDMNAASRALSLGYYGFMGGMSEARLESILMEMLAEEYRPLIPDILNDIAKAATDFAPIENLTVGN